MTSNNNKIDKKVINYDVVYSNTDFVKARLGNFDEWLDNFERKYITSLVFDIFDSIKVKDKELIIYSYISFSEWQKIKNKLQENRIAFWEYPCKKNVKDSFLKKLIKQILPYNIPVQCKIDTQNQLYFVLDNLWPLWDFIIRICNSSERDNIYSIEDWFYVPTIKVELLKTNLCILWKFYHGSFIEIKTKYLSQKELVNIINCKLNDFPEIELIKYDYDEF